MNLHNLRAIDSSAVITRGDPMKWPGFFDMLINEYLRSRHTLEARYNHETGRNKKTGTEF